MSTLSSQAQATVIAFGHQPGVTPDQVNNLQAVINASPALIDQVNNAVAAGHLRQFAPLTHANAGGEYDGQNKVMRLPLAMLTTPSSGQSPFKAGEPTFVLGHELQHGFNHAATKQAYQNFFTEVSLKAQEPTGPRNYTAAIARLIGANRDDEAEAEIGGWNAIVDRVKSTNPNPTLRDIYQQQPGRMKDFIDEAGTAPNFTYSLKPNLTLNPDLTLGATTLNVEAMGQNYFDKPPKQPGGLGHHGNSDYANYYGAYAIGVAAELERHYNPPQPGATMPRMALDLTQLRLTEKLMEENGINLGANTQPMPYFDRSATPPTAGLFQHTRTTHQHTIPIAAHALETERAVLRQQETALQRPDPSQADHPNHVLYQQIRSGVEKLEEYPGRRDDIASEHRMAASLLVLAKQSGLERVDHVVLSGQRGDLQKGDNVFIVQGRLADPAHSRTMMRVSDAMSTPEADSYRTLDVINQQKSQHQIQSSGMEQHQEVHRRSMTM
jgi:hypothetical protein